MSKIPVLLNLAIICYINYSHQSNYLTPCKIGKKWLTSFRVRRGNLKIWIFSVEKNIKRCQDSKIYFFEKYVFLTHVTQNATSNRFNFWLLLFQSNYNIFNLYFSLLDERLIFSIIKRSIIGNGQKMRFFYFELE